jgi:MoxR-like ATPase
MEKPEPHVIGTYTSLEVQIWPLNADNMYPIEATVDGKDWTAGDHLPGYEVSTWLSGRPQPGDVVSLLTKSLFDGPGPGISTMLYSTFDKAFRQADQSTEGRLRVQLWIDQNAPELHGLPWESLPDPRHREGPPGPPIATNVKTPLSRYVGGEKTPPPPLTDRQVKMLVVVSGLTGQNDMKGDLEKLLMGFRKHMRNGDLSITILANREMLPPIVLSEFGRKAFSYVEGPVTLEKILHNLQKHPILHFIGEGSFQESTGLLPPGGVSEESAIQESRPAIPRLVLHLEEADGRPTDVRDLELLSQLEKLDQMPRLAFLIPSTQKTYQNREPFAALAPMLVAAGIPAVVAAPERLTGPMEDWIGDFYHDLLGHGLVDVALNRARSRLMSRTPYAVESLPVLWTQLKDGRLLGNEAERKAPKTGTTMRQGSTERPSRKEIVSGPDSRFVDIDSKRLPIKETIEEPAPSKEKPAPPKDRAMPIPTRTDLRVSVGPAAKYEPPDNRLTVEVYSDTVKVTFEGSEYTGPNRIDPAALLKAYANPQDYGELLFGSVFHSGGTAVRSGSGSTLSGYEAAARAPLGVRFRLQLSPTDLTLHRRRWEYLKSSAEERPLALKPQSPFYRYLAPRGLPAEEKFKVVAHPLKILAAICNPVDLGESTYSYLKGMKKLNTENWRRVIETALKRLKDHGVADYEILPRQNEPVTISALVEALKQGYHVLHLVCHGLVKDGDYSLIMEREDGKHERVDSRKFEVLMGTGEETLRLAILVACHSTFSEEQSARDDELRELGPRLVLAGIPAVIAMQSAITFDTAQRFTQHFYDDLARCGRVDMAVAATRLSLFADEKAELGAWGIPALFMDTDDGTLFSVRPEEVNRKLPKLEAPIIQPLDKGESIPGTPLGPIPLESPSLLASPEQMVRSMAAVMDQSFSGLMRRSEAPVLAPGQRREDLDTLKRGVEIIPDELKAWVKGENAPPHRAAASLSLPDTVYGQIASALNTGKHLVLIGAPGTGKTSLAKEICEYARKKNFSAGTAYTTATADWTTFDTVGGYVPAADQTLQFRPGSFLSAICRGEWLVIDEINRTEIDKAFGELFTVLSGQGVDLPYRVGQNQVRVLPPNSHSSASWVCKEASTEYDYVVHPNWRVIGTMNVYDKSSLFSMSLAFMRRFAFVDVDLPEPQSYATLRGRWIADNPGYAAISPADLTSLTQQLDALLDQTSPLMKRRALGPAIAADMIKYVADRYPRKAAGERMLDLLGEAFLLYAVPQLDGLDHAAITEIYTHLTTIFLSHGAGQSVRARIKSLYPYVPEGDWVEGPPPD